MLTNDILRRVRYALDLNDAKVSEIFALAGRDVRPEELAIMFKKEDEAGFVRCPDSRAREFFSGLIIKNRGKKEGDTEPSAMPSGPLTANDVLWYLRIAMQLRDGDLVAILKKAGVEMNKSEVNALFRKKGHPNYRPCGDQLLRNFLSGFTSTYRP